MKTIIALTEEIHHAEFFFRMQEAFYAKGYNVVYLSTDYISYRFLKKQKTCVYFVHESSNEITIELNELCNCMEVKMGKCSIENAKVCYQSMWNILKKIEKIYDIDTMFIFQGVRIAEIALNQYAKKHEKKTLFFELSNIPGKIFCDKKGSNKGSDIFSNISILKKYDVSISEYENWKTEYLKTKIKNHIVPQTMMKEPSVFMKGVGFIVEYFYGIPNRKISYIIKRFMEVFFEKNITLKYDYINHREMEYIFFPLQVSKDSQIIMNSKIGITDAVYEALSYAKSKNLFLVIKPHPAELSGKIIKFINELRNDNRIKIVNLNTFQLIKYSKIVITINSTVGLEAMIMGRKVLFLGDSFYEKFNAEYLRKYILRYLINIDYFSTNKIKNVDELLKRIKEGNEFYKI